MSLVHAPLCSQCEQHRTKHHSGICSRCRRLKGSKLCISCGERETSHPTGLCHRCRMRATDDNNIDNAIAHYEKVLVALKMVREHRPFSEISTAIGMSKSGAYNFCQRSIRYPLIRDPE